MASSFTIKSWVLAVTVVCMFLFWFHLGKADEYGDLPATGTGTVVGDDPAQIVAKALLCFNNKYVRLTASGNLDVPLEYANEYCAGPCLSETNLVLDCIENIMKHFLFYNKATIPDIRDTIQAGCGYGPERGHFDVTEHIEAEENGSSRAIKGILIGMGSAIIGLTPLL
ncbi:hypothetical protein V6N13_022918 [Hibiscus sabdariffa]|uniref:DUF7731 domain-containing protein n=1 Tax=Hibiscus sabdariffa TaxID=183260 RepID=A0ABR2BMV6_9ROSI